MPAPPLSDEELQQTVATFIEQGMNVSASARLVGVPRTTFQARIKMAMKRGFISEDDLNVRNPAVIHDVREARDRKRVAFEEKSRKGDWRKPILKTLPDRPFRLKLFGDPHLEDDACDFDLFEEQFMDMGPDVYGICVGDWFNNWIRGLAGIYAENSTKPSEAWTLLCHLMEERGEFLLGACSGNHDDWSHGPMDPVKDLMRRHGVSYRKGAIRLALNFPGLGRQITVAARHKWKGSSIYSPGHGGKRAAMWGWQDHVTAGGHTHVDDYRLHVHADSGFKQHHFQVSAFKAFDEYADVHGFHPHRIKPFVDLVIDPRLPDDDVDLVKPFWRSDRAAAYLRSIMGTNG